MYVAAACAVKDSGCRIPELLRRNLVVKYNLVLSLCSLDSNFVVGNLTLYWAKHFLLRAHAVKDESSEADRYAVSYLKETSANLGIGDGCKAALCVLTEHFKE